MPSPPELKKSLVARGFEVYRTLKDRVLLAERVRENLLMDSGVAALVGSDGSLAVRFAVRVQEADFRGELPAELFVRARELGAAGLARGYVEAGSESHPVKDPSAPDHILDVWHEVSFERGVPGEAELFDELTWALSAAKVVQAV